MQLAKKKQSYLPPTLPGRMHPEDSWEQDPQVMLLYKPKWGVTTSRLKQMKYTMHIKASFDRGEKKELGNVHNTRANLACKSQKKRGFMIQSNQQLLWIKRQDSKQPQALYVVVISTSQRTRWATWRRLLTIHSLPATTKHLHHAGKFFPGTKTYLALLLCTKVCKQNCSQGYLDCLSP